MSKGKLRPFVDYSSGPGTGGDTGYDEPASIRPILNGEDVVGADPAVGSGGIVNRPGEFLRKRTEKLREILEDLLYLRDADRALLLAGPGRVTWPGSTTAGASGVPTLDAPLYLVPALTPGAAQAAPIPPVASTFGRLVLVRAGGSPGLVVSSLRRSYDAGDRISVTVVPGTALAAAVQGVPARAIILTAPAGTTLAQAQGTLGAVTAESNPLVSVSLAAGSSGPDLLDVPQAKRFIEGNADGEGHTITPANLATFFSSNPTSALAEGDTLGIQYAQMIDEAGGLGGRRQSTPENSNTAIPAGAFFNSRMNPEKLTGALPVCKVVSGRLVFPSGAQVPAGAASFDLSGVDSASLAYGGGPAWFDGTTNPPTSVEAQLDKIIADLASTASGASGAHRVGVNSTTYNFGTRPAESVKSRIDSVAGAKANTGTPNTFVKSQTINTGDESPLGAMLQSSVAPVSEYKPVLRLEGGNGAHVRVYQKRNENGLAITANASWDPTINAWRHDSDALAAAFLALDLGKLTVRRRAAGAPTWPDDGWSTAPLALDLLAGSLTVPSNLVAGNDVNVGGELTSGTIVAQSGITSQAFVATTEADIRHGDRTRTFLPARTEAGWIQSFIVRAPPGVGGVAFCDLDLAVGDRVKRVRVVCQMAGTNVVNAEILAAWLKLTAAVGASSNAFDLVMAPQGSTGPNANIQAIDLVPATPVVIGANEKHMMRLTPKDSTQTTKDIHRVEVLYDRP